MSKKQNLYVDSGADFSKTLVLKEANGASISVTGYTGAAKAKPWFTYGNTVTFDVSLSASGFTITANAEITNAMSGTYVWTGTITSNTGNIREVYDGTIYVSENID